MQAVLAFFSDLLLFTGGLAVLILWVLLFMVIAIEIHDAIFGEPNKEEDPDA